MASDRPATELEHEALWRGIDLSGTTAVIGLGEGRLIESLARQAVATGGGQIVAIGFRTEGLAPIRELLSSLPVDYVNARPR
ncbi:MAG: hypothetical protein MUQ65_13345, partial [Armatimonadetes bacterium]|nr:hypothetical protein [Armatimonadota bacterium]